MQSQDVPVPFDFQRTVHRNQLTFTVLLAVRLRMTHPGNIPLPVFLWIFRQHTYNLTKANTSAANSPVVMPWRERRGKDSGNPWKPQHTFWLQKIILKRSFAVTLSCFSLCVCVSPPLLNAFRAVISPEVAGAGCWDTAANPSVFCSPAATRSI